MREHRVARIGGLGVLALVLLVAAGCDRGGLSLATVTGTVSYRGKALDHGQVVFVPAEGTPGQQAVGDIQPDGSFRMKTGERDGAALGQHVVTVHCRRVVSPQEAKNLVIGELLMPAKYALEDQTPLRITVKKGTNELPIVLED